MTMSFKQPIGRTDALRTGTYSKTLTFTLSTTHAVGSRPSPGARSRAPG